MQSGFYLVISRFSLNFSFLQLLLFMLVPKVAPESISETLELKNFLGEHALETYVLEHLTFCTDYSSIFHEKIMQIL